MAIARPRSGRQRAIEGIQSLILARFPDARFEITPMPDSRSGTAIWTYTSADWDEVRAVVGNRELDLLVDEDIFIGVIPMPVEALEV